MVWQSKEETKEQQMSEQSVYRQFVKSLPSRKGTVILVCHKCWKAHKEEETTINALNAYAFDSDNNNYTTRMCDDCMKKEGLLF